MKYYPKNQRNNKDFKVFYILKKGEITENIYEVGDKIKTLGPVIRKLQEGLYKNKNVTIQNPPTRRRTYDSGDMEDKVKALISIIKAMKAKTDKGHKSKFFTTDDTKVTPNDGTNIYVNNNGIKGHSYVYNIQNCKYIKLFFF